MKRGLFHRREHSLPSLNTSSLPDLIFTVLFFFMIVTHMRDVDLKVHYVVPQGTELQKMTPKSAVTYIYIGRVEGLPADSFCIQLNNRLATVADIREFVETDDSGSEESPAAVVRPKDKLLGNGEKGERVK